MQNAKICALHAQRICSRKDLRKKVGKPVGQSLSCFI